MAKPPVPARALPAKPAPAKLAAPRKPAPAKAEAAKPKPIPARRGSEALGLFAACAGILCLSVVALPVCVLLVVGMIPTIVAYIIDQTPRRTLTLTVGPLNLAGTAPYCFQLWFGVDTMHALGLYVSSVWVWLVMYVAAAIGWLLHLGMPVIVHFLLERSLDGRKAKLVVMQRKLRAEWGDDVDAAAAAAAPSQAEG